MLPVGRAWPARSVTPAAGVHRMDCDEVTAPVEAVVVPSVTVIVEPVRTMVELTNETVVAT